MPKRKEHWEELSDYTQKRYMREISREYGEPISATEAKSLYENEFSIYRKSPDEMEDAQQSPFRLENRLSMYDEEGRKVRGFSTEKLTDRNGNPQSLNLGDYGEDEFEDAVTAVYNMLTDCKGQFVAAYNEGYRRFQIIIRKLGESKGRQFLYQTLAVDFLIQDIFDPDSRYQLAETITELIVDEGAEIDGFNFLE